jgi:hypothetical protein
VKRLIKFIGQKKESWKPQEFELNDCTQPDTPKNERAMILWHKVDTDVFSDTIMLDIDKPMKEVMGDLDITHVKAVFESSSGRAHVLVHVSGLNKDNFKNAYDYVGNLIDPNFDKSCNELSRGFFIGNKIIFQCDDSMPIDLSMIKDKPFHSEVSLVTIYNYSTNNNDSTNDTDSKHHSNPYKFIQGQRLNWLKHELKELARKENTTDNLETFAYPYVNSDTVLKKEVYRFIAWQRKNFKPFKVAKKKPYSGRKSYYNEYRAWRDWGKSHSAAMQSAYGKYYSPATSKRARAKFNKENGITLSKSNKLSTQKRNEKFEVINVCYKRGMSQREASKYLTEMNGKGYSLRVINQYYQKIKSFCAIPSN